MTHSEFKPRVIVVGAGPVGLALAADLGWRGVPTLLVDKGTGEVPQPKTSGVNIRTMEYCRRWGLRARIRAHGMAKDYPRDRVWVTSLNGYELARQTAPSLADDVAPRGALETFMRIHQTEFDPILRDYALKCPSVRAMYLTQCVGVTQDDEGVTAELIDVPTGARSVARADYIVSCEGAGSVIRKSIGIELAGNWNVNHSTNAYFRSNEFLSAHDKGRALFYNVVGPEGSCGYLFAVNGTDLWQAQILGINGEKATASREEVADVIRRFVGRDFAFDLLDVTPWTRRRLLADRYRIGRVFLAGDAIHQMPPSGTLGMNTGVADATNLSWKLEAMLAGWGGAGLLDSYQAERRPVAERNAEAAVAMFQSGRMKAPPGPAILDDGDEGARVRAATGARLLAHATHPPTEGMQIGYRYEDSPICLPGDMPSPPSDYQHYRPTTYPGARAPDGYLDGNPILDRFGRGFVLVRVGARPPDCDGLVAAAAACGVPLTQLDVGGPDLEELYERRLVLVRPDGHVAWRGDAPPADPRMVIDVVRGARPVQPQAVAESRFAQTSDEPNVPI
ncbi:MAG TPA: FAD-dependent monooxygenase [Alphaproteobacteria bacterium]|jgi:2-polyprenyl-6-methoxyphenol hydroxylase-like FAD-dependent oxidoreductase|nr:FAD-dependent monooxygenase [Alphaproteobacteria bacterium]